MSSISDLIYAHRSAAHRLVAAREAIGKAEAEVTQAADALAAAVLATGDLSPIASGDGLYRFAWRGSESSLRISVEPFRFAWDLKDVAPAPCDDKDCEVHSDFGGPDDLAPRDRAVEPGDDDLAEMAASAALDDALSGEPGPVPISPRGLATLAAVRTPDAAHN